MAANKNIKVNADEESFPQARAFVEAALNRRFVNASIASEAKLLFEALFHEIVSQVGDRNTELEIGRVRELGHTDIKITFAGKRFSLPEGDVSSDPQAKVIETYSDKISCSYQGGYNVIRIAVSQSAWAFILPNLIAVIALALIMGFAVAQSILAASGVTERFDLGFASWSLASAVDQIIPSSIIEPFETISPIPMIAVALLIAGALSSMGQNFNAVKRAIDVCYDLFSNILKIVMTAFPVACFLLFLEILLAQGGIAFFLEIIFIVVIVFVCTLPVLIMYALSLKARSIPVRDFARKIWPLVKENFAIGSVIDAVPYNTRYCEKNLGISRQRLEKELPILAQTSLDGNCFILMLLATIYIFIANCEVSWINIAVIALIVMFLSFGAPNQPGSILIGMLIILAYLHSDSVVSLALCFELFCGGLQNILNVISSVVTVAKNERQEEQGRPTTS